MPQTVVNDELIRYITETIVREFNPRRIILFGSHARGDARPDSDIDLLVEMESDKPKYQRIGDIYRAFGLREWSMDVLVYTPEELESHKGWSFHNTVLAEGKTLYERAA